jgi:uncharacterized protein YfdQ (DUF2303 family)
MMADLQKPEAQAVAEIVEKSVEPRLVDLPDGHKAFVAPTAIRPTSVKALMDEYLTAPERRKGTAKLADLDSFIAHVNRFKDSDSAVFCAADFDAMSAGLTSVLDYHRAGSESAPRFGTHRGSYAFPFSDEWKAWNDVSGEKMEQAAFAALLEDRIADVCDPATAGVFAIQLAAQLGVDFASPSRLLGLSRGIEINVDRRIAQVVKLDSGEARISFEETHSGPGGADLKVPGGFLLQIPVFQGDAPYQIPARLRYKAVGPTIVWTVELYRLDRAFRDALSKACDRVRAETGLPMLMGSPE